MTAVPATKNTKDTKDTKSTKKTTVRLFVSAGSALNVVSSIAA